MSSAQVAGRSVRRASRHFYGAALLRAACSAALLSIGTALGTVGAGEVGALFIGVGLLLAWDALQRKRSGRRFAVGATAEERVGSRLWKLEELGWLVAHDVQKGGGGNIDHLVHSPAVTFVIETKAGGWRPSDLVQVQRHAEWAIDHYQGEREVVPVLCVQASKRGPEFINGVHVVGAPFLVDLLLDRG